MVGLLPPDVVAELRSLRNSYVHRRPALGAQAGARAGAGLTAVDKLIGIIDRALATGEAPIHNMTGAIRPAPKFLSQPVARPTRGEMVRLLAVGGGTSGGANRGWWQVQTRAGVSGWIERKELFPDAPHALSSAPGMAGHGRQPDEIELGVRDTVIY